MTVVVADVSFVSATKTNAFMPHPYAQAAHEHLKTSERKIKISRVF